MNGGLFDASSFFSFRETFVGDAKTRARAAARSTRERDLVSGLDEFVSKNTPFRDTSRHWNARGYSFFSAKRTSTPSRNRARLTYATRERKSAPSPSSDDENENIAAAPTHGTSFSFPQLGVKCASRQTHADAGRLVRASTEGAVKRRRLRAPRRRGEDAAAAKDASLFLISRKRKDEDVSLRVESAPRRFISRASRASAQGAPTSSKGVVVPRPSHAFVASSRQVPTYASAEVGDGTLGDGGTHGSFVSSHAMPRRHRRIGATRKSVFANFFPDGLSGSAPTNRRLNRSASSPTVMPCRIGTETRETNESKPASTTTGPSVVVPPSGLGRSRTTTRARRRFRLASFVSDVSSLLSRATATSRSYRLETYV